MWSNCFLISLFTIILFYFIYLFCLFWEMSQFHNTSDLGLSLKIGCNLSERVAWSNYIGYTKPNHRSWIQSHGTDESFWIE